EYYVTGTPQRLYEIDINTLTANEIGYTGVTTADIAVSPTDGQLYAWSMDDNQLVKINPNTAAITLIGSPATHPWGGFGALYFNAQGEIIAYGNDGTITATQQETLVKIDPATGVITALGIGPGTSANDGCSCAYGIELTKAASPTTVNAGDVFTYTFTVFNRTGGALTDITFNDVLTDGFLWNTEPENETGLTLGTTSIIGTATANFTISTAQVGESSFTIDVLAPAGQCIIYPNQADLTNIPSTYGTSILSDDPNTAAITDSTVVTVTYQLLATVNDAAVCSGTMSAGLTVTATTGTPTTYSIDYDATAEGEGFTDVTTATTLTGATYVIPAGAAADTYNGVITYIDANGCSGTDAFTVTVTDQLLAGDNNSTEFCQGSGGSTSLDALRNGTFDNGGSWAQTAGTTTLNIADPASVDFSAAVPGTYIFTYTHAVSGSCPADVSTITVTVTDQLLAGDDNSTEFCEGSGASTSLEALRSGTFDNGGSWAQTAGTTTLNIANPAIVDFSGAVPDTYTFTYTHVASGSCLADEATITVTVNAIPTLAASSSDPTTCIGSDGTITLTLTNVPDGTYTINYMDATPLAQTFTDVTVATGSATISGLSAGTYNDLSITVNGCTSAEDVDISLTGADCEADLSLTKTSNESSIYVDEQLVFTITVTNDGPATATGVQVTDTLPTEFITYVSDDSGGNYVPATGIWTIGSIASGASVSLNITVTGIKVGNPTNTAEVTASNQPDKDSTPDNNDPTEDDQDSVTVTIDCKVIRMPMRIIKNN
ncbi:MAG: DUF11 domain-containing protein, partial [Gammaproteobacteria bacterium]|nr:DUF11 domain-containing protein [Gammaproteobacteria bacterium]